MILRSYFIFFIMVSIIEYNNRKRLKSFLIKCLERDEYYQSLKNSGVQIEEIKIIEEYGIFFNPTWKDYYCYYKDRDTINEENDFSMTLFYKRTDEILVTLRITYKYDVLLTSICIGEGNILEEWKDLPFEMFEVGGILQYDIEDTGKRYTTGILSLKNSIIIDFNTYIKILDAIRPQKHYSSYTNINSLVGTMSDRDYRVLNDRNYTLDVYKKMLSLKLNFLHVIYPIDKVSTDNISYLCIRLINTKTMKMKGVFGFNDLDINYINNFSDDYKEWTYNIQCYRIRDTVTSLHYNLLSYDKSIAKILSLIPLYFRDNKDSCLQSPYNGSIDLMFNRKSLNIIWNIFREETIKVSNDRLHLMDFTRLYNYKFPKNIIPVISRKYNNRYHITFPFIMDIKFLDCNFLDCNGIGIGKLFEDIFSKF